MPCSVCINIFHLYTAIFRQKSAWCSFRKIDRDIILEIWDTDKAAFCLVPAKRGSARVLCQVTRRALEYSNSFFPDRLFSFEAVLLSKPTPYRTSHRHTVYTMFGLQVVVLATVVLSKPLITSVGNHQTAEKENMSAFRRRLLFIFEACSITAKS